MDSLKNPKGQITMYLMEKRKEGLQVPPMSLQARNSLNFTGLKEYFATDGKLSGFAYGYPNRAETYNTKKLENPFYKNRDDGFLFLIHQDPSKVTPSSIEFFVLSDARVLISSYCKQLQMGGFDEALKTLREQASTIE
ncbi:MAG: hypothetical protein ACRCZY_00780 [Phocaeicola sp.]